MENGKELEEKQLQNVVGGDINPNTPSYCMYRGNANCVSHNCPFHSVIDPTEENIFPTVICELGYPSDEVFVIIDNGTGYVR